MAPQKDWSGRDVIGSDTAARSYQKLPVTLDIDLVHRPSRISGRVVAFTEGQRIVLCDTDGNLHEFKPHPGVLLHRGRPVELIQGEWRSDNRIELTASGSIALTAVPARTARESRIWVEGIHDAELIEKIWGHDLRVEGIVVEPMHGADELTTAVRAFNPGKQRKLGILLDHLVTGSKESQISGAIRDENVMVRGHPYVDIWQAVRPQILGIAAWPVIPRGTPWKEGVIAAMGRSDDPGRFWGSILSMVADYRDIETPLVNAVEQLIDFVIEG